MKPLILLLGLLLRVSAFAQADLFFDINFGSNPPPHTPGVPESGALLTSDFFYAAIYLDNTPPTSGSVVELSNDGSFVAVFQFTNLVFAAYPPPPGATAFDYEQAFQLTGTQIERLLAGQWYVRIAFDDTIYLGQITPRGPLALLNDSNLSPQQKRPLLASLESANASLARGNRSAAINQLEAFQVKVAGQILSDDPDLAADLIAAAQVIIDLLSAN
jgi:hypothetical protein